MHAFSKYQITQLPHTEIDVCCDTRATLTVAYNSVAPGWPCHNVVTGNNTMNWGEVFIYPYVELFAGSGSNTAPYTLWVHFENVSVTGLAAFQSSKFKPKT